MDIAWLRLRGLSGNGNFNTGKADTAGNGIPGEVIDRQLTKQVGAPAEHRISPASFTRGWISQFFNTVQIKKAG